MTVESLKADLQSNLQTLTTMGPLTSSADIVLHLKNTLWPFVESLVTEVEEQDECIENLLNGAEEIIHPETAKVFANVIVAGLGIAKALEDQSPGNAAVKRAVDAFRGMCKVAQETLEEVTVLEDPDDEDEDEDSAGSDADDEEDDDEDE